ncbi:M23 family metallopeptidase [Leptothoe sp. PORK10 BA2]|uniref:M23 family metallopeptidase n=1 Tax=Leptothoe sp. PORK10 BA2 TaxID=3110254 RepID=UPI002B1FDEA0|nr:M23 family metallopeptidase [Leptothoe sp. PORK10 BA2]MEA5465222.1 M23 family metallopeptidase [Leptothoe sp. PORK10 BA2]
MGDVSQKMKSITIFISGLIIGFIALFIWAWIKIQPDVKAEPTKTNYSNARLSKVPFEGEWFVFWGGETPEQNAHHGIGVQNFALDLVIHSKEEKSHKFDGRKNEDYYCWNKDILAAHEGKVVVSVDGIPDNIPGKMNPQMVYGNVVMIQDSLGFVSVYAHLKNGSVSKRVGDLVSAGDRLGSCGNSGNSSEPHLHFHVQSESGFESGLSIRPLFDKLKINGLPRESYYPIKSERISP